MGNAEELELPSRIELSLLTIKEIGQRIGPLLGDKTATIIKIPPGKYFSVQIINGHLPSYPGTDDCMDFDGPVSLTFTGKKICPAYLNLHLDNPRITHSFPVRGEYPCYVEFEQNAIIFYEVQGSGRIRKTIFVVHSAEPPTT